MKKRRYLHETQLNLPRVCAVFAGLLLLFSALLTYAHNTQAELSGSVLRLHVIADSNTATDQALKLKVRNRILKESEKFLIHTDDRSEAIRTMRAHISEMEQAAQDEVRRNGYSYPVQVEVGQFPFPTKSYGNVMLPAGRYDAVRVKIGSGQGENWWCVMFPPLCFVNGVAELPPESEKQLKESLSAEEYKLITGQSDGELPVQVKFKLVELFGKLSQ